MITTHNNKMDLYLLDNLNVINNPDGTVDTRLVDPKGIKAMIGPFPTGLMEIHLQDSTGRFIDIEQDGMCHNIEMCNFWF